MLIRPVAGTGSLRDPGTLKNYVDDYNSIENDTLKWKNSAFKSHSVVSQGKQLVALNSLYYQCYHMW